ncbi:MAG: hypothetical protein JXP34_19080 [Planctomycetes bacterium]|nr:hypothetical protein [Planctomycetota bacterium]
MKKATPLAPDPAQGLPPPVLAGRVLDRETRRPVAGAGVRMLALGDCDTATDTDGRFAFSLAGYGDRVCVLRAAAVGYASEDLRFAFDPRRAHMQIEIPLARGADVEGRVAQRSGAAVAGARVYLAPDDSPPDFEAAETRADGDGRFRVTAGVAEGRTYWIAASAPDRVPNAVYFVAPPRGELVIELDTGVHVRGIVRDPDGQPIPGVSILWEPTADQESSMSLMAATGLLPESLSGDDGGFGLCAPDGCKLAIGANKEGWDPGLRVIDAKETGRPIDLVLKPRTSIERMAIVLDPAGVPMREERLLLAWVGQEGRVEFSLWVLTDSGGRFLVPPSFAGGFAVLRSSRGVLESISIGEEQPGEIIVRLEPAEDAILDLVDASGGPMAGFCIGLALRERDPPGIELWRETDTSGRATFEGLCPGVAMDLVTTRPAGFEPSELMIRRGIPNVFRIEVRGARGIPLRGRIQGPAGSPFRPGWVALSDGLRVSFPWRPDSNGAFALDLDAARAERCDAERLFLFVEAAPWLSFHPLPCPIPNEGVPDLIIIPERSAHLRGTVRNADDTPFDGEVGILLWREHSARPEPDFLTRVTGRSPTDQWGQFSLSSVPAGLPICLAAAPPDEQDLPLVLTQRMILQGGEERGLGILTIGDHGPWGGSDVTVCVKDTFGRPVGGVGIQITVVPDTRGVHPDLIHRRGRKDETGACTLKDMHPHDEARLSISIDGRCTVNMEVGGEPTIEVLLPAPDDPASASVRIRGCPGSDLVRLAHRDASGRSWSVQDWLGRPDLVVPALPPGKYRVERRRSGSIGQGAMFDATIEGEVMVAAGCETLIGIPCPCPDDPGIILTTVIPEKPGERPEWEFSRSDGWRLVYSLFLAGAPPEDRLVSIRLPVPEGAYDLRIWQEPRRGSETQILLERKGIVLETGSTLDLGKIELAP